MLNLKKSKKEQTMFGCPFCPEAFLWVGLVFTSHLQKHVLGKVTSRSYSFLEELLAYGGVPSESGTESAVEDSLSSVENVPVKIEVFDDENDSFEGMYDVCGKRFAQTLSFHRPRRPDISFSN